MSNSVHFPDPVKLMVCVPAEVLSDSVRVAVRVPVAEGVNVTETVQVALPASVPPTGQVLVCAKSPALGPVIVMLLTFSKKLLLLVSVESFAELVVPTVTLPKESVAGTNVAVGRAPDPVKFRVLKPAEVLSVMVTLAFCEPVAVGEKITLIVHVAPAAKLPMQLFVCVYSEGWVPLSAILLMVSVTNPLFFTVEVRFPLL